MLAEELARRGHSVVWWASTFSHQRKTLLFNHDERVKISDRFDLRLLFCGDYSANFSLRRYLVHKKLGRRFSVEARKESPPDIIIAALPIIDLAYEAVNYAREYGIPVFVDIRDLWPQTILERMPIPLRCAARLLLSADFYRTKSLFRRADGIIAVSKGFLAWGLQQARLTSPRTTDRIFYLGYPATNGKIRQTGVLGDLAARLNNKIIFTFVGSFGSTYELKLLCEVAKIADEKSLDSIHFLLAGDGEQFADISARTRNLSNISLLGWLDQDQIRELLGLSHVGLAPYIKMADMVPNKPFEYFSAGLPIISSLQGEMEELIEENSVGFSYRPGDVRELYLLIDRLAADPALRNSMAANARRVFESTYREDLIYSAYADHLESMVASRGV
ncbi:MAG: glycosyltransferase family 4 protein [Negativicutes bacterium]|nr:glycosyltransferase family 4 protein [Negativicutes bacterium]